MARRGRDPEGRMPLREHLGELRRRLLLALAGILLGAIAGWFLSEPVIDAVADPLTTARDGTALAGLNFQTLGAGFDLRIQVAVVIGLFFTSPWWIGQLWLFLVPALHRAEKLVAAAFAVVGAALFITGAAFAWWLLPHVVEILTDLVPSGGTSLIDARSYLVFVMRLMVTFGIAFLLPLVMVGLTAARLVAARTFLRGWRWAVVGAFVFAAFANPLPDAWSMIGMATPILLLYFGAIGVCWLIERIRARRDARRDAGTDVGGGSGSRTAGPAADAGEGGTTGAASATEGAATDAPGGSAGRPALHGRSEDEA